MGTSKRVTAPDSVPELPGPGKYQIDTPQKIRSENWKCQSEREILKKSEPSKLGPGVYNTKPAFGEGPKVIILIVYQLSLLSILKKLI